ncbi:MAG: prepilin-type N-terminal cleavage/methylation domain-containing protein [Cystobacter sp.]
MKSRTCRGARGFTLVELMVASSLSLIVLAAALWSAAELQRRGTFEESLMEAQNTLRAVRELLVVELQRAGMGMGSASMVFGKNDKNLGNDLRYAIIVSPEERFDGNGLFPKDDAFKAPAAGELYSDRVSDALQVWGWDSGAVDPVDNAIGMIPLSLCTQAPNAADLFRTGNDLCTRNLTADIKDRLVMVVKPESRTACIMRVTEVIQVPGAPYARITVVPGYTENQPALTGPCTTLAAGAPPADRSYWGSDKTGSFLLLMRGTAFRVNWASGVPVLERREISSDTKLANPGWVALSQDVEMIRLRLGVMKDLTSATSDVLWFPDKTQVPVHPAIDKCTDAQCTPLVPGGWVVSPNLPTARDALMSRVRMVQVDVITRTARKDTSLVRESTPGKYLPDADGNPQDGFKRRSTTLEIMPRNFSYAGVLAP